VGRCKRKCCKRAMTPGYATCAPCRSVNTLQARRWRRDTNLLRYNETQRKYREKKKQLGQCSQCKEPPIPGQVLCAKHKVMNRNNNRRYVYGHSYTELLEIQERQGNVCLACGEPFDLSQHDLKPVTDHCHETGNVRGILHGRCNLAVGQLCERHDLFLKLADYVKNVCEPLRVA
jgi:hypothetical protein